MKLSHNKDLYIKLFSQIARMHDEVSYRKHLNAYQGRSGKRKDYPSVSVGAELYGFSAIGHHHNESSFFDFHPLVIGELTSRLGTLNEYGANYPFCQNRVGHCAENYAATGVINKFDPHGLLIDNHVLSEIEFTKAFRPRTWKNINWCENCHTMYD